MKYRMLGNTGIAVSELAFGGVEIGIPYSLGVQSKADMLPEPAAIALLRAALESGITFFDTARTYGDSERLMGLAFHDRRQQVVLATKSRPFRRADGSLPDDDTLQNLIRQSLEESLSTLQTDYVDVYMVHHTDEEILTNERIAQTFTRLKQQGLVRATGVSTYTPTETELAIDAGAWDVIQLPFNLLDQRHAPLFGRAAERGIGLMVRSVLMRGLLTDTGRHRFHPALKAVENHIHCYDSMLNTDAPTLVSLATKFALAFPPVSAVLVGIDQRDYLHQSLATVNGPGLSPETVSRAIQLAYPDPDFLNMANWVNRGWFSTQSPALTVTPS
ncbi:aldo/keto reductase [Spirosoma arcticum]